MSDLLMKLAKPIAKDKIRVVDLTQTLQPSTPVIQLPPPIAPSNPFSIEEISRYDERGPAWYWNNISLGEHTGTHFDAPVHWVTGKDYRDGATDTIPRAALRRAGRRDRLLEGGGRATSASLLKPEHIEAWEAKHGRIPDGAWVLMRTDWSKRTDPAHSSTCKEDGPHSPGPDPRGDPLPGRAAQRQRLGRRGGRHRPRPGLCLRAALPGP